MRFWRATINGNCLLSSAELGLELAAPAVIVTLLLFAPITILRWAAHSPHAGRWPLPILVASRF